MRNNTFINQQQNIFQLSSWSLLFYVIHFSTSSIIVISQSAAGLCIGVGSFYDPPELPGLAHFLEHSKSCDSILNLAYSKLKSNMCTVLS